MAKQVKPQNTGTVGTQTFDKELIEDIRGNHLPPNSWTQARNAIPNTTIGDLGDLSNEPSNQLCASAAYRIIGAIHLEDDRWVIFSTDETNSEIGLFREDRCTYEVIVNDQCLNFSDNHLIIGVSKENHDCTWQVYWEDGNNPSRTMNVDNVPWIQDCNIVNDCQICTDTDDLDCDAIRLAPLVVNPCFTMERGASGGELVNGSYYVVAAYTINQQKVTDYSLPSNIQGLFSHSNVNGSLDIVVGDMDDNFDEFELVLVSFRNEQTAAYRVGIYSTRQKRITIDAIDSRWPAVGLDLIPIRNSISDKADAIYRNGDYMLRVGPTNKFDFNYQPLANQIVTKWVSTEYPADYYREGGNNTGYMRDEVYPFFVRWVYDTGDKTPSFHIPGRVATPFDLAPIGGNDSEPEVSAGITPNRWRVQNTAAFAPPPTGSVLYTLPDGGDVIAEGTMGYWESTEIYDDDRPEVWNASSDPIWGSTNPAHDLCGKPIRHHRFPENDIGGNLLVNHYNQGGTKIRVMGVKFENIQAPLDNDGNVIPNIVGYEILRGTREGNKTVLAKGMINNMRQYFVEGDITGRTGLHANYPYNDLRVDPYLSPFSLGQYANCPGISPSGNPLFSRNHFSFHSPDTTFKDPFLSAKILKNYVTMYGGVDGSFEHPDKHPEHKLITDLSFVVAVIVGIGYAILKVNGTRSTTYRGPSRMDAGMYPYGLNILAGQTTGTLAMPYDFGSIASASMVAYEGAVQGAEASYYESGLVFLDSLAGAPATAGSTYTTTVAAAGNTASTFQIPGIMGYAVDVNQQHGPLYDTPLWLRVMQGIPQFIGNIGEGFNLMLTVLKAMSKWEQHGLQYQSHCFYDNVKNLDPNPDNTRRSINDAIYVGSNIQDFGTDYRINNVYRSKYVALDVGPAAVLGPGGDDTRFTITSRAGWPGAPSHNNPTADYAGSTGYSHYSALKQRLRNQYGQIEGIVQVPVSTCKSEIGDGVSPVLFNGDIYIGRYTEKNTMFFFYNWLFDQPDGTEFDYSLYSMIPYPRYWMNTKEYDFGDTINGIINNLTSSGANEPILPSGFHSLDRAMCVPPDAFFTIKKAYMYLFNSGVRDFFVESEVNVDYRDWGDNDTERHYDYKRWTDLRQIFNSSIIKATNFYKYDYSLSVAKLFNNYISWGNVQPRNYDPQVAEDCFVYRQNRVLYSLPQHLENLRDNWRIFLPNNYRDFKSRVTAVKPVNKNGAMFLFENESPSQFLGVDQLQTDAGTKITIGDGGLFSQPQQNLLNTDDPYEYGSCQSRLGVMNTASGIFWMSQNQGKIFHLSQGVKEISAMGLKWWFATYLPYRLTDAFPDFELTDNPVAGIGCQCIYDNKNQLAYFCKKDYELREEWVGILQYNGGSEFSIGSLRIELGDPIYFEDASWTVSYDPKTEGWIGYHDWHPQLTLPAKGSFLSTMDEGIWKHNDRCDSFCNFYGTDYPFEVEYAVHTPQVVNTLRSVEYFMQVFKYDPNCYDRFHVLDFNFDETIIYNTEQCSGLLRLNLSPKNNAPEIVNFPQVNPTNIDILYSKEEQKYRFNQFWDVTDDRGEFNPAAERVIFNTEANGYIRNLNPNNLNYDKFQTERKRFRHHKNTVLLRRRVCGNRNMVVSLANNKNLYSPR